MTKTPPSFEGGVFLCAFHTNGCTLGFVHHGPRLNLPPEINQASSAILLTREFTAAGLADIAFSVMPSTAKAVLPFNPHLPEDVWFKLYTFKPKVPLVQALALVSRPLSDEQVEHLQKEKRPMVWTELFPYNFLGEKEKELARAGRLDHRLHPTKILSFSSPQDAFCNTLLTEDAAESFLSWHLRSHRRAKIAAPTVNYMLSKLSERSHWETALTLVDNFEGSISDLCRVSKELNN